LLQLGCLGHAIHCDESATVFVAVWYMSGIAAMGALGAVVSLYVGNQGEKP
jgi:hypothetical protein